jgi:putative SOS response-associated peptidase YedK
MIFSTCSKPFPDALRHHRVSTRVNSVKNDDPACTEEFLPNLLF